MISNPEDPNTNETIVGADNSDKVVLEEPSLEELAQTYRVDVNSSEKQADDEVVVYGDLLGKLTDGSNVNSIKIAMSRYTGVPAADIRKEHISSVSKNFPGGDIADLSNYLDRNFSRGGVTFTNEWFKESVSKEGSGDKLD